MEWPEDQETLLETLQLMETAQAFVAVYDRDDRLRYANEAFREAWGVARGEQLLWSELMRRSWQEGRGTLIETDDFEAWLRMTAARRGKVPRRAFETDLHDGRWLWMTETMHSSGWMMSIATDMTSIRSSERALRQDRDRALRASQTDELTGLPNRRYALSVLETMLARGAAGDGSGKGCCVAILDIDHFKHINDSFGHATGDVVLKDFATRLAPCLRKTDIIGRIGGEEFILILPGTTLSDAAHILQRMLESVRQARPVRDYPLLCYTFSAGIASARPGERVDGLFQRADQALYAAKTAGRNRASAAA